jgi:hypothetical protein
MSHSKASLITRKPYDSFEKLAPESGAMTEAEAASWANALHEASDEGVFFGASNYYTYIARRPE